ncbi:MAG: ABC transporter permease [Candidatus Kapabacteria bacterium]|nr:ABC transporter permease [Candidatus Kapabacteria bacterium]
MKIPFSYIYRNFLARKLTTFITVGGIALTVFIFAAVLMLAYGVEKTLVATGATNNVIVTRKASNGEISSIIDRETGNTILTLPAIAKSPDGKPLATADGVVVINLTKKSGGLSNVVVRGVQPAAFTIREKVKITQGKQFTWGSRELVVGKAIMERFEGAGLGEKIKMAGDMWTIVGVIEADGSGFDSEMWGDVEQLQQAFNRTSSFSTLTFRINDPSSIEALKMKFAGDPRLNQFEPEIEQTYYAKQSEMMALFINILGITITIIFSIGAIIGAMITMYAAVANRTTEVGTLRALGFQRGSILFAFLTESLLLSITGGLVGLVLASFLQFFTISTLNFASFSELAFSFALSPSIVITSLVFTLIMGFTGGFLPSWRASRLKIIEALRAA